MFHNIGVPELLIVLVLVLIFFGVGKLPEVGKALGGAVRGFREGQSGKDTRSSEGPADPSGKPEG
ncbi:MAG: twin-arginine translocase TatA/TatE family subunit [Deltaproteobacteria bacterium]|nr:twin-arginine translocase TatA/TatE family subunit [Deltaproteobacteria bacterium]